MNSDDLKAFRESLNMSQQDVAALLGIQQPAWNRYEKGTRDVPAYIQREIEFFKALSKRSQQVFINRLTSNGEQAFAGDCEKAAKCSVPNA